MVEVHVRVQDELDVFDAKAERADVGGDLGRRFRQIPVNESKLRPVPSTAGTLRLIPL
jgi:hypothetical protein